MKFAMAELVTPNGDLIYVNPFFVEAILPKDDYTSFLRIKNVRQQLVMGATDEVYGALKDTIVAANGENKQKEIEEIYYGHNA